MPALRVQIPQVTDGRKIFAAIHMNLANCSLKREHYKDAAEHCRIVATEDPANAKALFRWAKARLGDGDYEAAIEKLEAAQKLVRL